MTRYKIISICFILLFVNILSSAIGIATDKELGEIDYNDPTSIAAAQPSEIAVEQAIASGNGNAITSDQWVYSDNLNFAEDISLYPNAQEAVGIKHSSFSFSLTNGHVTYKNGIIQNSDAPLLNLNDANLAGTSITSLEEGGFRIERGNSIGLFAIEDVFIGLDNQEGAYVEIKPNNEILLSDGSYIIDSKGTVIISLMDGTEIVIIQDQISVNGISLVSDKFENYQMIGDRETGTVGSLSINYQKNSYSFEHGTLLIGEGKLTTETAQIESDFMTIIDTSQLNSIAVNVKNALGNNLQKVCDVEGCIYYAEDVSLGVIVDSMKRRGGPYYQILEEQIGVPEAFALAVGTAGLMTSKYLPSQKGFQTRDGEFQSIIGYDKQTLRPFLTAEFKSAQVRLEPSIETTEAVSVNAVVVPRIETGKITAHFDLGKKGTIDVSSSGPDQMFMTYRTEIGSVISSVNVHKSEDMKGIFVNLDLSKVLK